MEFRRKGPTEVAIDDIQEVRLGNLGFAPLVKTVDTAVFFDVPTVARPRQYDEPAATAARRSLLKLPYTMAVSRWLQYVRMIERDERDVIRLQDRLNTWLAGHVSPSSAGWEEKRLRPLRSARAEVDALMVRVWLHPWEPDTPWPERFILPRS